MTEKIMQCCYTNAVKETGGKISSGWQAVVVSEHIPQEAYVNCVNLQNANSTIQSHMVDERGNVLNLLEITGDGAYVYVSRTQYGLTDRLGRPNMFSHAYIFSWKQEDILTDPNWFLTLTADNFAQDEETAGRPKDALERTAPFTLERAMERAGLTSETYLTLIQCVYTRFTERKAAKPVFVQYDGSEEQLQAILYCVYYGLPYYVRRSLSVASSASNTTKDHHLVFSTAAASHDSFIVPQTGENNVLTPRIQRRIARYGFVDYAVQNCRSEDMDAYFQRLESLAMELGDSTASDELILKIAHQLIQNPAPPAMSDEELNGSLSDALRSRGYGSRLMEEYISAMLREVCRRRLVLTEESDANLEQWLVSPVTAALPDAGEQYNIYVISTLSAQDAARRLHSLPEEKFERYRQTLKNSEGGLRILDCYHAEYGLEGKEITWKALKDLLDEAGYIQDAVMVRARVDQEARKLYEALLEIPGQAPSAYQSLISLMQAILTQEELEKCKKEAYKRYWDTVTPENFAYRRMGEYQAMCSDGVRRDEQCKQCKLSMGLCAVLRGYKVSGDDELLQNINHFANEHKQDFSDSESANDIQKALERELCLINPQAEKLFGWIDAVIIPDAERVMDNILELRGQLQQEHLQQEEYSKLVDEFQEIKQKAPISSGVRLVQSVAKTMMKECRSNDDLEHCVPLDVWLVLGKSLYPKNIFQIFDEFDEKEPCIFHADEEQVVKQSKLLETSPYADQAEDYAQSKGKSAKVVHRWLKVADRRRRDEERKQRKEADGSVLDRGRAFLAQLTSGGGEDKPGGRHLQGREASKEKDSVKDKDSSREKDSVKDKGFSREKDSAKDKGFSREKDSVKNKDSAKRKESAKDKDTARGGIFGRLLGAKRDATQDTKQDTEQDTQKKNDWGWNDED